MSPENRVAGRTYAAYTSGSGAWGPIGGLALADAVLVHEVLKLAPVTGPMIGLYEDLHERNQWTPAQTEKVGRIVFDYASLVAAKKLADASAARRAARGPAGLADDVAGAADDVVGLGDDAARGGSRAGALRAPKSAVQLNKHHTVPKEVLKSLPDDVANNPLVRGRAGAPNRWSIPENLHKQIHKGAGGGAYNEAFKRRLLDVGGKPTVDDVLRIRSELVKQFGLEGYRP